MKKIIVIFGVLLFLFSCKKKESPPPENGTTSALPTNTLIASNGFLTAELITNWGSGAPQNNRYFSSASLSQTASIGAIVNPSYNGTITINNTELKAQSIGTYVYYLDTTNFLNLSSQRNFQFISTTTLPSFVFNNTDPFPYYPVADGYLINDTLFKTQNLSLSLINTSGYDEAACVIYDIANASNSITKVVAIGTTNIIFTPNDLTVFTPGTTILCGLSLKKYNIQTFLGKNYKFETSTYNNFYMIIH